MTNPDNALLPGMFVNAAVVLPPQPDMMVLPETAVDYTLYGDSVYVIREDGKDASGPSDPQSGAHPGQDGRADRTTRSRSSMGSNPATGSSRRVRSRCRTALAVTISRVRRRRSRRADVD